MFTFSDRHLEYMRTQGQSLRFWLGNLFTCHLVTNRHDLIYLATQLCKWTSFIMQNRGLVCVHQLCADGLDSRAINTALTSLAVL